MKTLPTDKIKELWDLSNSQYDFAQACYRQGRIDAARESDRELNAVLNILERENERINN